MKGRGHGIKTLAGTRASSAMLEILKHILSAVGKLWKD